MYDKPKICSECGGSCCKNCPGIMHPDDVQRSKKKIKALLLSKKYAVDWWEGDIRPKGKRLQIYFLRPAIKGFEGMFHPSWGGECIFLENKGCKLFSDDRPMQCRNLEPKRHGLCILHGHAGKIYLVKAWIPYQKFFDKLRKEK